MQLNKAEFGRVQVMLLRSFIECIHEMRDFEVLPIRPVPKQLALFR